MDKKMIIGDVGITSRWKPLGHLQITNAVAMVSLQPSVILAALPTGMTNAQVKFITMQPEPTTSVRWTDTTTLLPTTAVGQVLVAGSPPLTYAGQSPTSLNFFVTAGSVNIALYA